MRDFDKHPYSKDEQRVADWLARQSPVIGAGDDPIGFVITSYVQLRHERDELRSRTWSVELLPLHREANGWWFWDETGAEGHGPYPDYTTAEQKFRDYSDSLENRQRVKEHVCSSCASPMQQILDTSRHKEWFCVSCGWVTLDRGDTRWV